MLWTLLLAATASAAPFVARQEPTNTGALNSTSPFVPTTRSAFNSGFASATLSASSAFPSAWGTVTPADVKWIPPNPTPATCSSVCTAFDRYRYSCAVLPENPTEKQVYACLGMCLPENLPATKECIQCGADFDKINALPFIDEFTEACRRDLAAYSSIMTPVNFGTPTAGIASTTPSTAGAAPSSTAGRVSIDSFIMVIAALALAIRI